MPTDREYPTHVELENVSFWPCPICIKRLKEEDEG